MVVIEEAAAVVGLSGKILQLKPWQKKTNRAPDCSIEIKIILLLSTGVEEIESNTNVVPWLPMHIGSSP